LINVRKTRIFFDFIENNLQILNLQCDNFMESGDEVIQSAFGIYKKYYLRSVLLEIFGKNEPLANAGIKELLLLEVHKVDELYHSVKMSEVMLEYEYLLKAGYFVAVESGAKITLSEQGIKALRECIWENLASAAFFGYKGLRISSESMRISNNSLQVAKSALRCSKIACWITGFALLASLISLAVALCKSCIAGV
jgi:hypothetical protein